MPPLDRVVDNGEADDYAAGRIARVRQVDLGVRKERGALERRPAGAAGGRSRQPDHQRPRLSRVARFAEAPARVKASGDVYRRDQSDAQIAPRLYQAGASIRLRN